MSVITCMLLVTSISYPVQISKIKTDESVCRVVNTHLESSNRDVDFSCECSRGEIVVLLDKSKRKLQRR